MTPILPYHNNLAMLTIGDNLNLFATWTLDCCAIIANMLFIAAILLKYLKPFFNNSATPSNLFNISPEQCDY
ncbi:hypothetical protein PRIPAC_95718 [Pristionchus pacificus]|uniref:Uncharacterized protein n=1 Tax=Pristionchus pacificus TaxID=54126 RepID=A0A2A6D2S0_PRIPA|nr:hypothetical protein PRIPAC_95718 [Pristionchus pacificus]|eukprot:PDM84698.1 hypothetical protein PRIPAC_33721 [Pristionchus pacificus]